MGIDDRTLDRVVEFHGHMCPGLLIGVRAAEVALAEIGPHSADEEIVAITETDMCGVDAVQFLTGCTFGKGNLIHRDCGKIAFTFLRRSDGKAIRISLRPDGWDGDRQALRIRPVREIFDVRAAAVALPPTARVFASETCAGCGESTMETRIRLLAGEQLCPPCFEFRLTAGRSG